MLVISVINLKGGSTKTTTAGLLLAAFHESGLRVLGVDSDLENRGLMSWRSDAELPWPVVALEHPHRDLLELAGVDRYDVAVIDTPPMRAQRGTVMSAVRISDRVVVPTAPNHAEYQRIAPTRLLIEESADLRKDGQVPPWAILLTRCVAGAASPGVYRQQATEDGHPIFKVDVGRRERFAQAQGSPIKNASRTEYGDIAMELLDLGETT
jgi:chromosome partitioning protein